MLVRATFVLLALLVSACGEVSRESEPQPEPGASRPAEPAVRTPEPSPADVAARKATEIFSSRCANCHGPEGAGDGPTSAGLNPKPRNFQEPSWQVSVTDAHIQKIIVEGGAAVGLSPLMLANPDLVERPAVVAALVAQIRGLSGR